MAASFDPDLAYTYGDIIGAECRHLGQHVLEGPGVCLHRTPIGGRNFEYFSEDPYLSGLMGVQVTKAIQDHDVIAMAKHDVVNDQEHERFRANVEVDEHVLRELYLLPFEMCCKDAEIASIMSAYNRVRGTYATETATPSAPSCARSGPWEGYVQSDFWSCRSAAPALSTGLDLEMPDAKWLNEETSPPRCTTSCWRSRPWTGRWCAASPRCSASASSSGLTPRPRSPPPSTAR